MPYSVPARDDQLAVEDAWADDFFSRMLAQQLSCTEFEAEVRRHWESGRFVSRAPATAQRLRELALQALEQDAGYASDAVHLGFRSQWLVGVAGRPGAIHIQAPPERVLSRRLRDLNRRPHQHDSGRIALVTHGRATFHVARTLPDGSKVILDCPVSVGDLIFWPAWTSHTFDAMEGFWLVSAMAEYVSPAHDGFVFPVADSEPEPDALSRLGYREFRAQ